jgi:hypothetical protein
MNSNKFLVLLIIATSGFFSIHGSYSDHDKTIGGVPNVRGPNNTHARMKALKGTFINPGLEIARLKRILAQQQSELDRLNSTSLAEPCHACLRGTDTDEMLKAVYSGNASPYIEYTREKFIRIFNNIIDGLSLDNGIILTSNVLVGGENQPKDRTRDSFKDALVAVIKGVRVDTIRSPSKADHESLFNFHSTCKNVFMDAIHVWMPSLISPELREGITPSIFSDTAFLIDSVVADNASDVRFPSMYNLIIRFDILYKSPSF